MYFASDNVAPAAPQVLDALIAANEDPSPAYGADRWTARAEALIHETFERDCAVFLVATGTAANALSIAAACPPWGAVLCHEDAHVQQDECNAPEFYAGGAKLIGLPGRHGKLTAEDVGTALEIWPKGDVHHPPAALLCLTQASESGTIYSTGELRAITGVAHGAGLKVHMDGARFANAVAALGCAPADVTWRAGVDILSLGATKGGAFAAEAVVVFDPGLAESLSYRRMRGGHLLSKGRLLGAQMAGWLENDAWLDLARHANAMAKRLADGLEARRVRLAVPTQANEVFAVFTESTAERLKHAGAVFYDWTSAAMRRETDATSDEMIARLVCSWATREEEVDAFLAALDAERQAA